MVANPSTSPENFPDGGAISPTLMKWLQGIVPGPRSVRIFNRYADTLWPVWVFHWSFKLLKKDQNFLSQVKSVREKLVPPQVGSDGSLQEWAEVGNPWRKIIVIFHICMDYIPERSWMKKKTTELIKLHIKSFGRKRRCFHRLVSRLENGLMGQVGLMEPG